MGYYIQTPSTHDKVDYLVREHGAEVRPFAPHWTPDVAIVCVVDNGIFQAAALCYSADELKAFDQRRDARPRWWLRMDKETAHRLAGFGDYAP